MVNYDKWKSHVQLVKFMPTAEVTHLFLGFPIEFSLCPKVNRLSFSSYFYLMPNFLGEIEL